MISQQRFPCGQTRRQALWQMGSGVIGLALASCSSMMVFFAKHAWADEPQNPLAPRPSHFVSKAKSCIFLTMNGGPSQVDTWGL